MFNQDMLRFVATREAFEGHLKTMSGLEFVVAQEPAETAPGTGTGVWVIRKQTRRKRPGQEDEITVHSTYFVMGENIYMAPSLFDIISSRMLNVFTNLDKFVSAANSLPNFTPLLGHTYLPPVSSQKKTTDSQGATESSRAGTPLPDSQASSVKAPAGASTSSYLDDRLLEESFNLSMRYGDEYMDENPITGQPGAFNLTSTGRGKENLPLSLQKKALENQAKAATVPTAEPEKAEVVPPTRKGSKSDKASASGKPKIKRKKSKIVTNPTTPMA